MATKPSAKKSTVTKKPRSNVAKSAIANKPKLPKKTFLIALIVIFVAAMGYLFLRLSRASIEGAEWTPDQFSNNGGSITTKADGRRAWVGKAGQTASISDPEWVAARGDQAWCLSARLESDGEAEVNLLVTPNDGGSASYGAWLLRDKGKEALLCPQNSNNVGQLGNILPKQVGAGNVVRNATVSVKGGGTVAVFKIARSLVAGTYVPLDPPAPTTSTSPSQDQNPNVPAADQPKVCPTYTLGLGSGGNCVGYAQGLLNAALRLTGTKDQLAIDNNYGTRTQNAVKMFQASIGKTGNANDGIIGAGTWPKLIERANEVITSTGPAQPSTTPGGVKPQLTRVDASKEQRTLRMYYSPDSSYGSTNLRNYRVGTTNGLLAVPADTNQYATFHFCGQLIVGGGQAAEDYKFNVKLKTQYTSPSSLTVPITINKGRNAGCTDVKLRVTSTTYYNSSVKDRLVYMMSIEPNSLTAEGFMNGTKQLQQFQVEARK